MYHLPLPNSAADDDAVIAALCEDAFWTPHLANWLDAYQSYRLATSDPWVISPATFNPEVADEQRKLYDTRKRSRAIKNIRDTADLRSCPMCGSPSTGSVDHVLPRTPYAEFSIMRANLVPACSHCNSAGKGNRHRGEVAPERFIHPYYDTFAAAPLWAVKINPPYTAATFDPAPLEGLPDAEKIVVRFHLNHVLGTQFRLSMATFWSTYPGELRLALRGAAPVAGNIKILVDEHLLGRALMRGINGWETAMLRGILADAAAIAFLADKAAVYPVGL